MGGDMESEVLVSRVQFLTVRRDILSQEKALHTRLVRLFDGAMRS